MGQVTESTQSTKDCILRQAAIDAARDALKRVPTAAIRVMDAIQKLPSVRKDMYADKDWMSAIICDGIANVLNNLPSVQQEQKTGKWIPIEKRSFVGAKCSLCQSLNSLHTIYCPNCGARMEE